MYKNKYNEDVEISTTEYSILSVDTGAYSEITKIINPFSIDLTTDIYNKQDKVCFLEIDTEYDKVLVVFKTNENPQDFNIEFESTYNQLTKDYADLYEEGILNIHLLNDDNVWSISNNTRFRYI